ncbi:MAG: bifunctional 5,10-methylenetetrahydrofolate dehydrogenase/5,10-methenyltetrahydrofolate cyclohydrolase [bacterium]
MPTIIDGKAIALQIRERLAREVAELKIKKITTKLVVILVGDNKASATYVRKKGEAAKQIGIDFCLKEFSKDVSEKELIDAIKEIQKDKKLSGLMIQLPLPEHLNFKKIIDKINPEIDVDCLTETSWGKLVRGSNIFQPPTAGAMLETIKCHKIDLTGKNVVVIGMGELVGKPLTLMLFQENCTITCCNIFTKDLSAHTKNADVVFSGVGKYNLLCGGMIKKGTVVIDAGVSFHEGKMYGDIEFDTVSKKASFITPTPGGIGPITVAKLLENTVKSAKTLSF